MSGCPHHVGPNPCPVCAADPPLRFAYADPPYVGQADRYPEHPDSYDWNEPGPHIDLMHRLEHSYDGWALSCSEPSLRLLLPHAPEGTRTAVWVKPFCAYKRNVRVAHSWEPVLWHRTAPRREDEPVGRDHLSAPITMNKGTVGAKPEQFVRWLWILFGYKPGDTIDDLFPGSGVVARVMSRPTLH